jgi:hypothetical protein
MTIDDQLVLSLRRIAGIRGVPFKTVVNEVLRLGIEAAQKPPVQSPYRTKVRRFDILPGIDPYKIGQISDEFEDLAKCERSL